MLAHVCSSPPPTSYTGIFGIGVGEGVGAGVGANVGDEVGGRVGDGVGGGVGGYSVRSHNVTYAGSLKKLL